MLGDSEIMNDIIECALKIKEKTGLRIKYVFHDYVISGFWLDYYETGEIK